MNLAFISPTKGVFLNDQNWLMWILHELRELGHTVHLNGCNEETDFLLGMTESQLPRITDLHQLYRKVPLILYNWDLHPIIRRGRNPEWLTILPEATEIWTQTKYHAKYCKNLTGLKHVVMPMGAPLKEELGEALKTISYEPFVMMASRRDVYKGWDLFEQGCEEMGITYESCHPDKHDRIKYIDILRRAKVMVVASEEEANAPMSSYEAAYLRKPLLLSDIPANREEWLECATYFTPNDKEDFKKKLQFVLDGKADAKMINAKKRSSFFSAQSFAKRIHKRLEYLKTRDE